MKCFEDNMKIINDAIKSIDEKAFIKLLNDCNEVLSSNNKIVVSGLGKNVCICEKFVGTMASLGMSSYFLHTNTAIHGDLGFVSDNDLVIILTKSGETAESVYLVEKLKDIDNVKLWLLSFNENSTLTNMIDNSLILRMKHEGDEWDLVPNNSTTLNLIVLQTLAIELSKMQKISIETFKRNHPGGNIGKLLRKRKYDEQD